MVGELTILVVSNQKGGVGKTTTAISLGAALVEQGERVLIVDLDPQANATSGLGISKAPPNPVYGLILKERPIEESIVSTAVPGLDIAPSSPDMAGAGGERGPLLARESRRRTALGSTRQYGPVIVDCPASPGLLPPKALQVGDARLPRALRLAEAPSHGLPISLYARRSAAAQAYDDLAREVSARLRARAPIALGVAIA